MDGASVRATLARLLPEPIRRSFLAKFLTALVCIVLFGSAIGAVFYVGISDTLDRQVDTEVRATTQMHATIYDNWFETRRQTLTAVAGLDYMAGGSLDRASRRLSVEVARSRIYTDIHLVDLDSGRVLASSGEQAIGRNYFGRVNETILRRGDRFVYPGQYRTFGNRTVVGLLVRLPTAARVLVAEVDPATGPDPPQTVTGASTFVVTDRGRVVFGPSNVSAPPPDVSSTTEITRTDRTLLSYRQLPGSPLVLVRRTPVRSAFAVKDAVLFSFASTLVLVFGILVAVSLLGGRAAASDLRRLVRKANAMASGSLSVDFTTDRRDEIGQLYDALAEMRDALQERIAEAESAREDAQAAKTEIEEQKAIISVLNRILRHNLRNDLVVINGHNSAIEEEIDGAIEHTDKIDSRTDDLLDKAEKAREIERLVAEEANRIGTIDVVGIVDTETERFEREYPDADISASLPDSAPARGHEALEFVVSNLVENAIEHNDSPRPTVEVAITRSDGRVEIEIADDGPGIPEAELSTLAEGYETATDHGSGLGLWLVNWLVDAMGGELRFERCDPTGTVVTVALAAAGDPPPQSTGIEADS